MESKLKKNELIPALGFLMPNFLGFVLFTSGPVLFSLVVAFSNWNLQQTVPFRWIGISKLAALLHDSQFWLYSMNTAYFLIGIPFSIAGSLFLAILLNQNLRGMTAYRTMFYLPSFTAGVALMILWKNLYNPEFGLVNSAISSAAHLLHYSIHTPQWLISTRNVFGLDVEQVRTVVSQWGIETRDAIIIMGVWTAIGEPTCFSTLRRLPICPKNSWKQRGSTELTDGRYSRM